MPRSAHHTWSFGDFTYDVTDKSLWVGGGRRRIDLQFKTRDLLHLLLKEAVGGFEKLIPRDDIWKSVWPEMRYELEENTLDQRVTRLRRVLKENGDPDCHYIISVKKQGMRFGVPVVERKSTQPHLEITSLAILPMINKTNDPNMTQLCEGITERLIIRLKKLSRLNLIPASTVFNQRLAQKEPRDIGREVKVEAVLTSRMLGHAKALSIVVELVDVESGWELWAEQFNVVQAKLSEQLEERIARELIKQTHIPVTDKDRRVIAKRHTDSPEAYDLYLKGRHSWNRRTAEGLLGGIKCFWLAIDLDSDFALAYAGVAGCYSLLSYYSGRRPHETFPVARLAAENAIRIDSQLAEAHTALAYTLSRYYWKWTEAEEFYKRAIELDPSYSTAHQWYAEYLTARGRFVEAIDQAERARKLAPDSSIINATVGTIFFFARNYDRAIEQYKKTIEKDPNCIRAYFRLARAYVQKGMFDESLKTFERVRGLCKVQGSPFELAELARHYAAAKDRKQALRLIQELKKLMKQQYISEYSIAAVYTCLQDVDEALRWLERAYQSRDPWLEHLNVDPRLDRIRRDARFEDLVLRVGGVN